MPAPRPSQFIDGETTGSLAPVGAAPSLTIGNDDVLAMQKKLAQLNMFSGSQDGMFGPRTARAIKAFEQSVGRTARGLLTPQIVAMIAAAADKVLQARDAAADDEFVYRTMRPIERVR